MTATMTRTIEGYEVPEVCLWIFDPDHSRIAFEGRHLMVTKVRGYFEQINGSVQIAETPEESYAELIVQASSIVSGSADRDTHLRSADFLDVDHFPTITFRSAEFRHVVSYLWEVKGDLAIRNITRPVTLAVTFAGGVIDPWGNQKIGFAATTEIDREQWGLTWNMPLDRGGLVVSQKIRLDIDIEAVRR